MVRSLEARKEEAGQDLARSKAAPRAQGAARGLRRCHSSPHYRGGLGHGAALHLAGDDPRPRHEHSCDNREGKACNLREDPAHLPKEHRSERPSVDSRLNPADHRRTGRSGSRSAVDVGRCRSLSCSAPHGDGRSVQRRNRQPAHLGTCLRRAQASDQRTRLAVRTHRRPVLDHRIRRELSLHLRPGWLAARRLDVHLDRQAHGRRQRCKSFMGC